MFYKFQVFLLIFLIPFGALYFYTKQNDTSFKNLFTSTGTPVVHIGEIPVKVEIAATPEARAKGLSNRKELQGIEGMLFIFDTADRHSMWMKDMNFPIDIIWISENLTVVGIERAVPPDSYPRKFFAPVPARYAVETFDRFTETFGIAVGDTVRLPKVEEMEVNVAN